MRSKSRRRVVAAASEEAAAESRAKKAPKVKIGGNCLPDQEWILEVSAAGELYEADDELRPASFLYDVKYQWDGGADEINDAFFLSFREGKPGNCNGTAYIRDERGGYIVDREWARLTRPCLANPGRGTNVCHSHGAQIAVVKRAAQQRLAEASEVVALRLIGLTAVTDENNNPIDHKDRIAASNSVLDRAGIKGGVEVEITTPGYQKVLEKMFAEDNNAEN